MHHGCQMFIIFIIIIMFIMSPHPACKKLSGEVLALVICLEQGADLHTAQLMPLPLTVSCFSKIHIGFTFLVPAHLGSHGKGPLNGCVLLCPRCMGALRDTAIHPSVCLSQPYAHSCPRL